jgi:CRP/FNR family transcriptional regulator, cyclic AMP receptor protein
VKRINNVSKLKLIEFLNRIDLFKSLNPRERNEIAHLPNLVVMLEQNETFIKRGEHDSSFYILLSGEVTVTVNKKHIADVGPGHFIGEVGFICNEPRSATVKSLTEIIALRITKELFDKLPIKVREGIKSKVIAGLVERVVAQNTKIVELEEKVADFEAKDAAMEGEDLTVGNAGDKPHGQKKRDAPKTGHRLDIKVP